MLEPCKMIDDDFLTHDGKHSGRIPATGSLQLQYISKAKGEGCAITKGAHAVIQYLKPRLCPKVENRHHMHTTITTHRVQS